jgi:hypothetical protein
MTDPKQAYLWIYEEARYRVPYDGTVDGAVEAYRKYLEDSNWFSYSVDERQVTFDPGLPSGQEIAVQEAIAAVDMGDA